MDEAMQRRILEIVQAALSEASHGRQPKDGRQRRLLYEDSLEDAKIGYFLPNHTYGKEIITTVGNDIYIKDVFLCNKLSESFDHRQARETTTESVP